MGNPHDQMTTCTWSLLFLAPHKLRFFRISLFILNGICSNKAQRTRKNQALSDGVYKHYSAIWSNSREHLKIVFAVNLGYRGNVHEF